MPQNYVIGVDGGGSKTAAVVLDAAGQVHGRATTGSVNHHNVGLEQAEANLVRVMELALADAGLAPADLAAAAWALAGVDRPSERQLFEALANRLWPAVPIRVENDALAALVAGVGLTPGVTLIAGTGMIAYGRAADGRRARAGGWGYLFDVGSGYYLVRSALRRLSQAFDQGAIPSSTLLPALLQATKTVAVPELLAWMYGRERPIADIAALAPLILTAAEETDLFALATVNEGAGALAKAVRDVAQQLGFHDPFPLVYSGGLLMRSAYYRALVSQAVATQISQAEPVDRPVDAAVGAAYLAWHHVGVDVGPPPPPPPLRPPGLWATEQANVLAPDLHLYDSRTLTGLMHIQDQQAVAALGPILPEAAAAAEAISARLARGGRLIYVGAGTSGRLGVLDASECPPTFNAPPGQVIGLMAGGPEALFRSIEGAEDDEARGAADLAALQPRPDDCVVGSAASGRTPYVLGALALARANGCLTVGITTNRPVPLAEYVDYLLDPLVGPELLTGSTRLKSGTAQKLLLNMLSTVSQIQLGKSYRNLMVDVQASNSKLQARAVRIVAAACAIENGAAAELLARCDDEVKVAIISYTLGLAPVEARRRLADAHGHIHLALAERT